MWKTWRAPHRASCLLHPARRTHTSDSRPFAAGDILLLRQKLDQAAPPILTRPLKSGLQLHTHKGVLNHDDIIGKRVRDVVRTAPLRSGKAGTEYRLHHVKLEEYVRLSRRLVTPIYPADANLIVDLLDLHVVPYSGNTPPNDGNERLEILEAGTGHGALSLYLSRAIHAANPTPPEDQNDEQALSEWKATRRAILHTIDSSAKFSKHASAIVAAFRRGMYHANIDFHATDVSAWTAKALTERGQRPFLAHAFLDLPNADTHLGIVARALRTDGCLIVFNPSITQILDCVRRIREEGIGLEMENVLELGVNGGSGGREWNVRAVKPRGKKVVDEESDDGEMAAGIVESSDGEVDGPPREEAVREESNASDDWKTICRPKVGDRIVGGGFLGIWRKRRDMRDE